MSRRTQLESRTAAEARSATDEPRAAPATVEPDRLTPEAILALQARAGNGAVGRILARNHDPPGGTATAPALPSITHLTAVEQRLLEGVLEKTTIDAAVRQIYDNMFQRTGWKYSASVANSSGKSYTQGGQTSGMCESYRNAFAHILSTYDGLRPGHPNDAIKNGTLDIELGNELATERFATRTGLTLMGVTALKGNVYLEIDGSGNVIDSSTHSINTFVFLGHWTLAVNGTVYDPIFHSIGEDNVARRLDDGYSYGAGRYLVDIRKPVPTKEFGSTFGHVTNWATFMGIMEDAKKLYDDNAEEVDERLTSDEEWQPKKPTWKDKLRGAFGTKKRDLMQDATALIDRIADPTAFAELVALADRAPNGVIRPSHKTAFDKLSQLVG